MHVGEVFSVCNRWRVARRLEQSHLPLGGIRPVLDVGCYYDPSPDSVGVVYVIKTDAER